MCNTFVWLLLKSFFLLKSHFLTLLHAYIFVDAKPNSTCGISNYYINPGGCENSVTGNSATILTGDSKQVIRDLSSLTNFSVTSEDQYSNTFCQSFSEWYWNAWTLNTYNINLSFLKCRHRWILYYYVQYINGKYNLFNHVQFHSWCNNWWICQ